MKPSHLGPEGAPRMVDVGKKPVTARRAVAAAIVRMRPDVLGSLVEGGGPKGDAFIVARQAGIAAGVPAGVDVALCLPATLIERAGDRHGERERLPRPLQQHNVAGGHRLSVAPSQPCPAPPAS